MAGTNVTVIFKVDGKSHRIPKSIDVNVPGELFPPRDPTIDIPYYYAKVGMLKKVVSKETGIPVVLMSIANVDGLEDFNAPLSHAIIPKESLSGEYDISTFYYNVIKIRINLDQSFLLNDRREIDLGINWIENNNREVREEENAKVKFQPLSSRNIWKMSDAEEGEESPGRHISGLIIL